MNAILRILVIFDLCFCRRDQDNSGKSIHTKYSCQVYLYKKLVAIIIESPVVLDTYTLLSVMRDFSSPLFSTEHTQKMYALTALFALVSNTISLG